MTAPIRSEKVDSLQVQVYEDRAALGRAAGKAVAERMRELLAKQGEIRMIFAAAPSQNETLATLCGETGIDWSRVTAFHMDEYQGLATGAPQLFSRFLLDGLFDKVRPGKVHLIDSSRAADEEVERYSRLLTEAPIDIVCLGIGENGHIAFNDPPVADFQDSKSMKRVELDDACRQQQVNDGCFPTFDAVPTHALTLTIPALMSGTYLYCMVPGPTKRWAVKETLLGPITTACPATILRTHQSCTLYVDKESYGGLLS